MADRNPSPPPDITDELAHADTIGDTAYSKHWLFSLLMRVIAKVDEKAELPSTSWRAFGIVGNDSNGSLTPLRFPTPRIEAGDRTPNCGGTPIVNSGRGGGDGQDSQEEQSEVFQPEDIETELEQDLCRLWDMTVTKEVLQFLKDFEIIRIFTGAIACSRYPRLVEICIGILANMACDEDICKQLTLNEELISIMLYMLNCRDTPILVETARFLSTVLSSETCKDVWLKSIRENADLFENMLFILQSSTKGPLLIGCVRVIEVCVRQDDRLAEEWCAVRLMQAVLEAQRQMEWLHGSEVEVFHRLFYIFSSNENGVVALINSFPDLYPTLSIYLRKICEDEPHLMPLERYQNSLRAIVPVLDVVACNMNPAKALEAIQSDAEVVPCLVRVGLASSLHLEESPMRAISRDLAVFFKDLLHISHKYLESSEGLAENIHWLPALNLHSNDGQVHAFLRAVLEHSSETRFFLEDLCCRLQLDNIQHVLHVSDQSY